MRSNLRDYFRGRHATLKDMLMGNFLARYSQVVDDDSLDTLKGEIKVAIRRLDAYASRLISQIATMHQPAMPLPAMPLPATASDESVVSKPPARRLFF